MSIDLFIDVIEILNSKNIKYIIAEFSETNKTIDVFIHPDDNDRFTRLMKSCSYVETKSPDREYDYIYKLIPEKYWKTNKGITIHSSCQMNCISLSNINNCKLPLDECIQTSMWSNRQKDNSGCYWILSKEDQLIYTLVKCVFDKKKFTKFDKENILLNRDVLDADGLSKKLNAVFFKFTQQLLLLLKNQSFDSIISEYRMFKNY